MLYTQFFGYKDALNKKPKATKCSDYSTIILMAHGSKENIECTQKGIQTKIEDVLEEYFFGF